MISNFDIMDFNLTFLTTLIYMTLKNLIVVKL